VSLDPYGSLLRLGRLQSYGSLIFSGVGSLSIRGLAPPTWLARLAWASNFAWLAHNLWVSSFLTTRSAFKVSSTRMTRSFIMGVSSTLARSFEIGCLAFFGSLASRGCLNGDSSRSDGLGGSDFVALFEWMSLQARLAYPFVDVSLQMARSVIMGCSTLMARSHMLDASRSLTRSPSKDVSKEMARSSSVATYF
jgi:hypothetical protein